MSDKNRKDGEFSLPDMREMFEHYTSVEEDEPAAQRSEMEDLARRYLDCGDDETGVESRQESGDSGCGGLPACTALSARARRQTERSSSALSVSAQPSGAR